MLKLVYYTKNIVLETNAFLLRPPVVRVPSADVPLTSAGVPFTIRLRPLTVPVIVLDYVLSSIIKNYVIRLIFDDASMNEER